MDFVKNLYFKQRARENIKYALTHTHNKLTSCSHQAALEAMTLPEQYLDLKFLYHSPSLQKQSRLLEEMADPKAETENIPERLITASCNVK